VDSVSDRITQTRGNIEPYLSKTVVVNVTLPAPLTSLPKEINSEDATVLPSSTNETERISSPDKGIVVAKVTGAKLKLSKLKLSGDVIKFRAFLDSFDSAIRKNPDLLSIDKFNYLKALLEGPPTITIQGLALSEGQQWN